MRGFWGKRSKAADQNVPRGKGSRDRHVSALGVPEDPTQPQSTSPSALRSASTTPAPPLEMICSIGTNAATPTGADSNINELAEQFWDKAYDRLKEEDPALVSAYEKILSRNLNKSESAVTDSDHNKIAQNDPGFRREQMRRIIDAGLDKTAKEAAIKEKAGVAMKFSRLIREIITNAIRASPEAVIPWATVCVILHVGSKFFSSQDCHALG